MLNEKIMKKINSNVILVLIYVFVLFFTSILRYEYGYCSAWDLGIFSQVIYSITKGKFFLYNVEPWWCGKFTCSFFSIHFSPILILVAPFYFIYPNAITLLFFKFLIFVLSLIFLSKVTEISLGKEYLYFILWIYLLHPGIVGAYLFDFHLEDFFPLFFFIFVYGWLRKKYWISIISYILLCLTLEYFSIYMSLVIITLILFKEKIKPVWKGILISIFIFLIGYSIYKLETNVINIFRSNAFKNVYLSNNLLSNFSIHNLMYALPSKFIYLLLLFFPFGLIPILKKPLFLIPLIPWLLLVLFAKDFVYINIASQYSNFVVPVITLSFIFSLEGMNINKKLLKYLVCASMISSLYFLIFNGFVIFSISRPFTGVYNLRIINKYISNTSKVILPDDVFVYYSNSLKTYTIIPVILYKNKRMNYIIKYWTKMLITKLNASVIVLNYFRLSPKIRSVVFNNLTGYNLCYFNNGIMIFSKKDCKLNFTNETINIPITKLYGVYLINGYFVYINKHEPYCRFGFSHDLLPGRYLLFINGERVNTGIVYIDGEIQNKEIFRDYVDIPRYDNYVICVNDLKNNTTIYSVKLKYIYPYI